MTATSGVLGGKGASFLPQPENIEAAMAKQKMVKACGLGNVCLLNSFMTIPYYFVISGGASGKEAKAAE
ncbi:MAG TPA: hypothetical protein PKJ77_00610 [Thermodesulfobacteriota bacterium]|nr:hypothetical protein [Thermodesulfobacteriota bacterium]